MNLGLRQLESFLKQHSHDQSLVLAMVTAIEGPSYRKPGAMMLVSSGLEFAGLISGGCLEGDLVEHAAAVLADGVPRSVTYDLSGADDVIFGLGLGCGGTVHLLLQRLDQAAGFGFLPTLFQAISERKTCVLAMALNGSSGASLAATALSIEGQSGGDTALSNILEGRLEPWQTKQRFAYEGPGNSVLLVKIEPPPRVLVCGAGSDAVPLARQVDMLGWECIVVDHRSAYARSDRFPPLVEVKYLQPDNLLDEVDIGLVDAAVVMSHNLVHDKAYLSRLAGAGLSYLGLLGPRTRRDILMKELGLTGQEIHGPAGLDIGAELPESIALSIVAEIHTVLSSTPRRHA
jgi:xanthine dehydrogenase accessory factor